MRFSDLKAAFQRALEACLRAPFAMFLPSGVAALLFHSFLAVVRRVMPHQHLVWLELLLSLVCCYPMGLAAETMTAKAYMPYREGIQHHS